MKFQADTKNKELWDAFTPGLETGLPSKETDVNTATDKGKEHAKLIRKNRKALTQLILAFGT